MNYSSDPQTFVLSLGLTLYSLIVAIKPSHLTSAKLPTQADVIIKKEHYNTMKYLYTNVHKSKLEHGLKDNAWLFNEIALFGPTLSLPQVLCPRTYGLDYLNKVEAGRFRKPHTIVYFTINPVY